MGVTRRISAIAVKTHTVQHGSSSAQPSAESLVFEGLSAPVSVVICAYNDETVLRACLASCAWCDDVHLADFESADRTVSIATELGAKVVRLPSTTGKPADAAREPTPTDLPLKHPWLFRLNADERFTPELVARLRDVVSADPAEHVFRVPVKVMFMERWLRRAADYPGYQDRLIDTRRRSAGATERRGTIDTPLLHYPFGKGMYDWLERCNRRSSADAHAILKTLGAGKAVAPELAARNPWVTFLGSWIFGLGCLDGASGLTYCVLRAYRDYQVKLKVREMRARGGAPSEYESQSIPQAFAYVGATSAAGLNGESRAATPAAPVRTTGDGLPSAPVERFGTLVVPGARVIVTGGSGFIGTNVVEYFHRAGAEVINIDNQPPRNPAHQPFWRNINICDYETYGRVVRDFNPEYFLHLAARTDLDETRDIAGYAANTVGVENTLKAVEGLKDLKRMIVTSSQLVCRPGYVPKHEADYAPHTVYGQSKIQTELVTRAWKNPPCPWTLLRPTSIWGPWFHIPYKTFFLAVAERKYMHQKGVNPIRSFGFVGNGVYEYIKMLDAPQDQVHGRTFYLADAEPVRVREWADLVAEEMGVGPLREIPLGVLQVAAKVGDVMQTAGWKNPPLTSFRLKNLTGDNTADMSPVTGIIGPMPYTVDEGVKITVDWMRREGSVPWRRRE